MEQIGTGLLDGVRVVETGTSLAARLAGMILADQGADVVRIALSGQEPLAVTDRGKLTFSADPGRPQTNEQIRTVLARADVVIADQNNSFADEIARNSDRVISCTFIPFWDGIRGGLRPFEESIGAATGLFETPSGVGKPHYFDLPIPSVFSGLHAVNSIGMALAGRARHGRGCAIEVPIDRVTMSIQILVMMIRSKPPVVWEPFRMFASPFMGVWKTAGNGYIYLHVGMPRHLRSFLFAIDAAGFAKEKGRLKELIGKDTKRDPVLLRSARQSIAISRVMKSLFAKNTASYWEDLLGGAGLCCTKIRTFEQWRKHPQVTDSGEIETLSSSGGASLHVPGPLICEAGATGGAVAPFRDKVDFATLNERWPERAAPESAPSHGLPLEGVRVLDMGRVISGPFAGRLLAEHGADVMHVSIRKGHLSWEEPFHVAFNRGKKSVTVDFMTPGGRDAVRSVVEKFRPDVVVHNFLDDAAAKIGIDFETLKRINPRVVVVDVKGYNPRGPWASRPGFEWNIQATSGIQASYSGTPQPATLMVPVNDLSAGLIASFAAALAYYRVARGDSGRHLSSYLSMPTVLMQVTQLNGDDRGIEPYIRYFRARDAWFLLAVHGPDPANNLRKIPELADLCMQSPLSMEREIARVFRKEPVRWWVARLRGMGSPAEIQITSHGKLGSTLRRELRRRKWPLFAYEDHEGFGSVLISHHPVVSTPAISRAVTPAQYMGSSTMKVLSEFGIADERFRTQVPELTRPRGGVFGARWARVKWLASQAKWIVAMAYRQLLTR